MAGIKNSAVLVFPGKPGKIQAGWHKPVGKHVRASGHKGTPDRVGTLQSHDKVTGNREAWLKLHGRLGTRDFADAVAMAAASY